MFIKNIFKDSRKAKKNRNYESISVFLDIRKFSYLWLKSADGSRAQDVCHVIHVILGPSLGKL